MPLFVMENNMQNKPYYKIASEEERAAFRNWLKDILHQMDVVEVTFTKKDGTNRVMNCTLKEGIVIPHVKTTDREKKANVEMCPVWDIDKNEWRSFTYESITEIKFDTV